MSIIDLFFEDICRELSIDALICERHNLSSLSLGDGVTHHALRGDSSFVIWYSIGNLIEYIAFPIEQLRYALARVLRRYQG